MVHEKEKIGKLVSLYSFVTNNPVMTEPKEVNGVQECKFYLGSQTKYIKVVKDFRDNVYAVYLMDNGKEECLDVIPINELDAILSKHPVAI